MLLRRRPATLNPGRDATGDLDLREPPGSGAAAPRYPEPVYGPSPARAFLRRMPLRYLALAALAAVLAGGAGAFIVANDPHVYQAQSALMIDQPLMIAADTGPAVIDKLSAVRMKYADLVVTRQIAGAAARQLSMSEQQVASSVYAEEPQGSLILTVGARSGDPAAAVRIARAATSALVAYAAADQARFQVPPSQRLLLNQVIPTGAAVQIAPTSRRMREVGVAAGLIAFLVVAFGLYVARPIPLVV